MQVNQPVLKLFSEFTPHFLTESPANCAAIALSRRRRQKRGNISCPKTASLQYSHTDKNCAGCWKMAYPALWNRWTYISVYISGWGPYNEFCGCEPAGRGQNRWTTKRNRPSATFFSKRAPRAVIRYAKTSKSSAKNGFMQVAFSMGPTKPNRHPGSITVAAAVPPLFHSTPAGDWGPGDRSKFTFPTLKGHADEQRRTGGLRRNWSGQNHK